ncbi:ABC transporter permease [Clostridium estertheticum]|uniref:FtsX-like permease family protein n=1 Tax=Clostridium estertheticum TaxID=238834 RepID=A0A7Y3WSV5_9CLOT|nr:FtsX-like permease family protein [Clostridium estertheticum]NNU77517.1 FtsX-like permease family protein [Clostridium estertheticum]
MASKKIIDLSTQMVDTKLIEQGDSIEKMQKALGEVSLVTYVFVEIASLIGVLNLFNTCRANIIIRKREIAMLKAIGVTGKQIKKIVNLEGAIFGIKGGLYGVAVSMIFVYSLYYFLRSIEYFKWSMPIHLPLIAMFVAVIGGYLSTIVPLIKVNKANIINEIKVEG